VSGAVRIEPVREITDEVSAGMAALLPQLSGSARFDADLLAALIRHDASDLFLARLDGGIVGAITLVTYPIPTGLRAHIDDVVVDGRARGHGIGRLLVEHALQEARRRGARTVDLSSRPSREAAIRLYTRLGFVRRDSNLYRYQI
jgi:ribosomal protein S18 acetylase RimI-like enzyme